MRIRYCDVTKLPLNLRAVSVAKPQAGKNIRISFRLNCTQSQWQKPQKWDIRIYWPRGELDARIFPPPSRNLLWRNNTIIPRARNLTRDAQYAIWPAYGRAAAHSQLWRNNVVLEFAHKFTNWKKYQDIFWAEFARKVNGETRKKSDIRIYWPRRELETWMKKQNIKFRLPGKNDSYG